MLRYDDCGHKGPLKSLETLQNRDTTLITSGHQPRSEALNSALWVQVYAEYHHASWESQYTLRSILKDSHKRDGAYVQDISNTSLSRL